MKLFLSSIRLPNEDERAKLFGDKSDLSVVIIPNAWDTYPEDRQKAEVADTVAQFKEIGFKTTVVDLVTSNSDVKESALKDNDFIWVMGGNTFHLNYRIQVEGFDKLLKKALGNGLVYGGTSAGAVVATPTLHGAENVDEIPEKLPEVIWDGLRLVDFGIVPHWGMEKYDAELQKMKQELTPHVPFVHTLTNDEAMTVIDGKVTTR
jgi:dipeptidase E